MLGHSGYRRARAYVALALPRMALPRVLPMALTGDELPLHSPGVPGVWADCSSHLVSLIANSWTHRVLESRTEACPGVPGCRLFTAAASFMHE